MHGKCCGCCLTCLVSDAAAFSSARKLLRLIFFFICAESVVAVFSSARKELWLIFFNGTKSVADEFSLARKALRLNLHILRKCRG